jgi:flagellar hook-basal body complex protein FliE
MPISALTSLAGPLASVLQPPTGLTQAIPDSGAQAIQGLGKMPDDGATISTAPTFGQVLQHAIGEVNKSQMHAADLSARFAAGEPLDVHQVMIAAQEASVSLNLAIQVRNKLVDGYQELMRVNV